MPIQFLKGDVPVEPELEWFEDTCFRVHPSLYAPVTKKNPEFGEYLDNEEFDNEESCDVLDIERLDRGRYKYVLEAPKSLYAFIIGAKGTMRRKLEEETKTKIRVPRKDEDGPITIIGPNRPSVTKCKRRIDILLMDAREKFPFTHFLSIPMTSDEIKKGFLRFQSEVMQKVQSGHIYQLDESLFKSPEKLHLTLTPLVLLDDNEHLKATSLLKEFKELISSLRDKTGPMQIKMSGLDIMNDDPSEVDIIYAKVQALNDQQNAFQSICDHILDGFAAEGLTRKQYEKVKLHVTLMNSKFCKNNDPKSEDEKSPGKKVKRAKFDAEPILRHFKNFNFGVQSFETIHLCQMKSTNTNDGYYNMLFKIDF